MQAVHNFLVVSKREQGGPKLWYTNVVLVVLLPVELVLFDVLFEGDGGGAVFRQG